MPAYDTLRSNIAIYSTIQNRDEICKEIKKSFNTTQPLHILGIGAEALVLNDEEYVYKYFESEPTNIAFLKKIAKCFKNSDSLYELSFLTVNGHAVIKYKYEYSSKYSGGYATQFADLLNFGRDNGFVFTNIKRDNFIVVNGHIKLIDYGKSIVPFDADIFDRSVERAYQLIRYYFLSTEEFKQIITKSYENQASDIDAGLSSFKNMIKKRYKEDLHDDKVLKIIKDFNPKKVLDYGAGKCKIANSLTNLFDVSVFDIDEKTILERANDDVQVLKFVETSQEGEYDLVNSNLVLCCIDNITVESVMTNMTRMLKIGGKLVVSICNPLFNDISNTELRMQGLMSDYHTAAVFEKHNKLGTLVRTEYHRPIESYIHLLQKHGYKICNVVEGDGVDCDKVMPISEHIIFDCTLLAKPKHFNKFADYRKHIFIIIFFFLRL